MTYHIDLTDVSSVIATLKAVRLDLGKGIVALVDEQVVKDEFIGIYVNVDRVATIHALPIQLKEMAIGWLLSRGIVSSLSEVEDVEVYGNEVRVRIASLPGNWKYRLRIFNDVRDVVRLLEALGNPYVKSTYVVKAEELLSMVSMFDGMSGLFRLTGGTHAAAIFYGMDMVAFSEDVGRHSAADKAIGGAAIRGVDFPRCILISSGRQPADMVIKAAMVGIPIVASIAGPMESGITIAHKTGVTLACFVRGMRMNIYTHPHRIEGLSKYRESIP